MNWIQNTVYHLFPLGSTGAPERNDFTSAPSHRLATLQGWLPYLSELGVTALLLGPVLESGTHGYDTADLFTVDRRLGNSGDLKALIAACHENGLKVMLDAVFHHVGRDFWAFRDVQERGAASPYRDWFFLDFSATSPAGDPFSYEGWNGHFNLVKLNTAHPAVREHLFGAARLWLSDFGVDGLRLDAADALDRGFQRDLAGVCREVNPACWLFGEVIHGDYREWAGPDKLDATTNYALYKGLYSSHNDRNYFELAHTLNRQFGDGGIYRDLRLYTFADNHDVPRIASILRDPAHLYPLHILLLTLPGLPSLYYGSEWGVTGEKAPASDAPLRPPLTPETLAAAGQHPDLYPVIRALIKLRRELPALGCGDYQEQLVTSEQFAFTRTWQGETVLVGVNAGREPVNLELPKLTGTWTDLLGSGETFTGGLELPPNWGRVLYKQNS